MSLDFMDLDETKLQQHKCSLTSGCQFVKCWIRDCIDLQKLVEQRLAQTWQQDFSPLQYKSTLVQCGELV